MDFLKISTNMFEDPKIKVLRKKYGRDGYFVYQHSLYLIAQSITSKNTSCELPYAAESISFDLGMEQSEVEKILATCIELRLLEGDAKGTVSCLKILSRLDMNTVSKEMRVMIANAREHQKRNDDTKNNNEPQPAKENSDEDAFNYNQSQEIAECHFSLQSEVAENGNTTVDKDKERDRDKDKEIHTHSLNTNKDKKTEFASARENFDDHIADDSPPDDYARRVFDLCAKIGIPNCNGNFISFIQRDFRLALQGIRELRLHSKELLGALENYGKVLQLKREGRTWWERELRLDQLCSGQKKLILNFLPDNFKVEDYLKEKPDKGGGLPDDRIRL